jgi:hypothetical protein
MSPVWAPHASAWQSCPPTMTGEPASAAATAINCVAGGHTSRSQPAAPPRNAWQRADASAAVPFIFQLPAIS